MRRTSLLWMVVVLVIGLCGPLGLAQETPQTNEETDEGVRSAFLVTRKKPAAPPVTKGKRPPKIGFPLSVPRLGLGISLYARLRGNPTGMAVRVDPSQIFQAGDALRFVLEPNTNGFVYVFYRENDGEPVMLYPDVRLSRGLNQILAHVPMELPSSRELNPQLQWFYFGNKPAIERLYFVVARAPLPGIPIGNELLAYCQQFPAACPWKPPLAAWQQLEGYLSSIPKQMSKLTRLGQSLTAGEGLAIQRDFGLKPTDPDPSLVQINTFADASLLIAQVNLVHQ